MAAGMWFWLLYVICFIFGMGLNWPFQENARPAGATFIVFVLIGLLGWGLFGSPIK